PVPAEAAGFPLPAQPLRELWPAGEEEARRRLRRFTDECAEDYQKQRDFPAVAGTSQLSAYLAAGVISPRQCLQAALS
ncbi:deoxyribodipyrimidine photo-lyase, partial [Pseudomonas frederiksbergensis]|nr:deoxyribodipyrimidine photo-lyase [Pseudomonas frederiksbergensis]